MAELQTIKVKTSDDYYRLKVLVAERDRFRAALLKCAHDEWNRGIYGIARQTVGDPIPATQAF